MRRTTLYALKTLPANMRLFLAIVIIGLATLSTWYFFSPDLIARLSITVVVLFSIWAASFVILPRHVSQTRVRVRILLTASVVTISLMYANSVSLEYGILLITKFSNLNLPMPTETLEIARYGIILVVWVVVPILFFILRDDYAVARHPNKMSTDFPDVTFKQHLNLLANSLRTDLDRADAETDWHHRFFVPLDAEVEVHRGMSQKLGSWSSMRPWPMPRNPRYS
jgi:hypothetical protein